MPSANYSPGTFGNVIPRTTISPGKNVAGLLDLTTGGLTAGTGRMEGQLTCKAAITAALTAGPTFAAYKIYGPPTPISSIATANQLTLAQAADIDPGQAVFVCRASTGVGEIATVSAVAGGTSLTFASPLAAAPASSGSASLPPTAYAAGDLVYCVAMVPSGSPVAPGATWAANSVVTTPPVMFGPAQYAAVATNNDKLNPVTVIATADSIVGYA